MLIPSVAYSNMTIDSSLLRVKLNLNEKQAIII